MSRSERAARVSDTDFGGAKRARGDRRRANQTRDAAISKRENRQTETERGKRRAFVRLRGRRSQTALEEHRPWGGLLGGS